MSKRNQSEIDEWLNDDEGYRPPFSRRVLLAVERYYKTVFIVIALAVCSTFLLTQSSQLMAYPLVGNIISWLEGLTSLVTRPSPPVILNRIQETSRLQTVIFHQSTTVILDENTGIGLLDLFVGQEIILTADGEVVAGINLEEIKESDITITGWDSITINLPEAEIFTVTIDESSLQANVDMGLFMGHNSELERKAREELITKMEQAALRAEILEEAQENAEKTLSALLEDVGYETVTFTSD